MVGTFDRAVYGIALKGVLDRHGLRDPLAEMLEHNYAGVTTSRELVALLNKEDPSRQEEAFRTLPVFNAIGYVGLPDWRQDNWGTSSNALNFIIDHDGPRVLRFRFKTFSSYPDPVFSALAERFRNVEFECEWWADFGDKDVKRYNFPEAPAPKNFVEAAQASFTW